MPAIRKHYTLKQLLKTWLTQIECGGSEKKNTCLIQAGMVADYSVEYF
jgi:hypothetical protein